MRDPFMTSMRNAMWAALASTALIVGCGTEEPVTTVPPVTPTPTPATTPDGPSMKAEIKPSMPEIKDETPKVDAPKTETPKVDVPKTETPKVDAPKVDSKKADASKLTNDEIAEIKKLPAADQEVAMKQIACPVSGEHLGEMGVPIKVSAEGKDFFICCKSCKKDVDSDPKAVVAKLAK